MENLLFLVHHLLIIYLTNKYIIFFLFTGFTSYQQENIDASYQEHPNEAKKFECLNCHHRFTHKTTIVDHLRYFCGRGPQFQCPYCGCPGSSSSSVYRHVRTKHRGNVPRAIRLYANMRDLKG